jgi:hypothetical protein
MPGQASDLPCTAETRSSPLRLLRVGPARRASTSAGEDSESNPVETHEIEPPAETLNPESSSQAVVPEPNRALPTFDGGVEAPWT